MKKSLLASAIGALIFCASVGFTSVADGPMRHLSLGALVVACCCHVVIGYLTINNGGRVGRHRVLVPIFCAIASMFWCFVTVAVAMLLSEKLQIKLAPDVANWLVLGCSIASLVLTTCARRLVRRSRKLRGKIGATGRVLSGVSFSG